MVPRKTPQSQPPGRQTPFPTDAHPIAQASTPLRAFVIMALSSSIARTRALRGTARHYPTTREPPTNPPPGEPNAAAPGPLPSTQKLHKLARWTASAPSRGLSTGLLVPLAAARRPNTRRRGMRRFGYARRSGTGWWMGRLRARVGWAVGMSGPGPAVIWPLRTNQERQGR
jgi:hypothetical protein